MSSESELKTALSDSNISSKDVDTAREISESSAKVSSSCNTAGLNHELESMVSAAQTFLLPVGTLQADVQRSVTEVHNLHHQLAQTPHAFDARASLSAQNLGDALTQNLSSLESELKTALENSFKEGSSLPLPCDTPTKDVDTAHEVTSTVSTPTKDVETAREIAQSTRLTFFATVEAEVKTAVENSTKDAPCATPTEDVETAKEITPASSFLLPVGILQADAQRSVTDVNAPQKQLTHTPEAFDARASSSAKNFGDAPSGNLLASLESEVKTGIENSSEDTPCATPTKDVETAREISESTRSNYSAAFEDHVKTALENSTKDVHTAREATETTSTFLLPVGTLQADVQRSVTEVHNLQQQLAQTPHAFDARASLSAQNLGDAPTQNLSSVENELKTAVVMSTTDISSLPQQPCDTPTKDVQTAREVTESPRSNYSVECEVKTAVENSSKGTPCDTPTKYVETAREVTEPSTGDITSLSRYHSFENLVPEIHPSFEDEDDNVAPTPEQLLAKDRQKRDPSSYYYIPSLNKGPVDRAPRLRQVSSQYAVHELSNYAMDEPNQAYKLKTQTLPKPTSTLRNEDGLRLRCVPSEYVLDSQPHHGVMWRK
uniref:Uncharacterized protein n=1 Tax=Panagrolaimus sp. PS1159 TaxID=55785 RepID=A0AC35EX29_9BILA